MFVRLPLFHAYVTTKILAPCGAIYLLILFIVVYAYLKVRTIIVKAMEIKSALLAQQVFIFLSSNFLSSLLPAISVSIALAIGARHSTLLCD